MTTTPHMRMRQSGTRMPQFRLPARWAIHVVKELDGPEVPLKCAIGFDDTLELIETTTPFKFEFVASRFTALFAASGGGRITAEMIGDVHGEMRRIGAFTSDKGKFYFDFAGPNYGGAGTAF